MAPRLVGVNAWWALVAYHLSATRPFHARNTPGGDHIGPDVTRPITTEFIMMITPIVTISRTAGVSLRGWHSVTALFTHLRISVGQGLTATVVAGLEGLKIVR